MASTLSLSYSSTIQYNAGVIGTTTINAWNEQQGLNTPFVFEVPAENGGTPLLLPGKQALPIMVNDAKPTTVSGFELGFVTGPPRIVWRLETPSPTSNPPPTTTTTSNNVQSTAANVTATTSTSVTPSAASSGRPNGSPSRVTNGAAAGIAIGCFVAGAILTGLVFWLCTRKRKSSRTRDYETSSTALVAQEKGFAAKALSLGSKIPAASPMSDTLPLPLEDKAVTGEISKISNSIKNHVQSYYHADRVSATLLHLDDIHAIGSSLPVSVGTISTLLGNFATREIALRFCIAWVICSRILPGANSRASLLPTEVDGAFQKIVSLHRESSAHTASVARWRVLTAELMQSSYVRDPFAPSDSRIHVVAEALDTLENILRPYADSRMDNGQRKRNLEEILKRSALFAFTLFSQPSTWNFDWQEQQDVKSGELCIFPALIQVSDETGQRVSPPRPFSEAVVRRLDG